MGAAADGFDALGFFVCFSFDLAMASIGRVVLSAVCDRAASNHEQNFSGTSKGPGSSANENAAPDTALTCAIALGVMHQQAVRSARREQPRFPLLHNCASYALQSGTFISRSSYVVHSSVSTAPARTVPNAVQDACAVVAILTVSALSARPPPPSTTLPERRRPLAEGSDTTSTTLAAS